MRRKFITLFSVAFLATPAYAYTLPWLDDPFNLDAKTGSFGSHDLRPRNCPPLPDPKTKLTMNEVVIAALCNNPNTKAAYLTLLANAAAYGTYYSEYFPFIDATAGYSHNTIFGGSNFNTGGVSRGNNIGTSAGISAEWLLFDFGRREANLDAAEQTFIAAGENFDSTLQGMIAAALQSYYQLLTSQNGVVAAQESEKFAQASYEAAQLRHKIGQVALADELQAKGSFSQAVLASQQARNQLLQDQAALAILMGLPADSPIEVAEMDDTALKVAPFGGKVQELIAKAQIERTDLAAQRAELNSARASLSALKRSDLPSISASAGENFDDLKLFNNATARAQSIGVSVSIPIFSGFAQTYNERAATQRLRAQEALLAQTELDIQQDVWNSWNNYETAKQSWDTSGDLLESATELRDVALGRYKEGLGTILDVLNAQSQYSSALQSKLQARYNLLTARADLVRAVGLLDLNTMQPGTTAPTQPPTAQ